MPAAACRAPPPQPHSDTALHRSAPAATRALLRILSPPGHDIALAQPSREQRQPRAQIDEARRNPHNQTAELLIFDGAQAPGLRGIGVWTVPNRSGEGEQRAENTGVYRRREYIEQSSSITGS